MAGKDSRFDLKSAIRPFPYRFVFQIITPYAQAQYFLSVYLTVSVFRLFLMLYRL